MKAKYLDSVVMEGVFARSYFAHGSENDDKTTKIFRDSKVLFQFIPFARNCADTINSALELLKVPDQEDGYIFATYKDTDLSYGIKEEVNDEFVGFSIVDNLFMNAKWFEVYKNKFASFVLVKVVFYKYMYFNKNLGYLSNYVYPDILASRKSYVVYYPKRLLNAKEIMTFPMHIPF